jgi:hypothetical protein
VYHRQNRFSNVIIWNKSDINRNNRIIVIIRAGSIRFRHSSNLSGGNGGNIVDRNLGCVCQS